MNIFNAAAALARVEQRLGRRSFAATYATDGRGGIVDLRGCEGTVVGMGGVQEAVPDLGARGWGVHVDGGVSTGDSVVAHRGVVIGERRRLQPWEVGAREAARTCQGGRGLRRSGECDCKVGVAMLVRGRISPGAVKGRMKSVGDAGFVNALGCSEVVRREM